MNFNIDSLFFPGMIFHELSHYIACLLCGVKIHKVKWVGKYEAYVVHDDVGPLQSTIISIAPFFLGNYFAFELILLANHLLTTINPIIILYYWLAISLAYYSFPSDQDAKNAFISLKKHYKKKIFGKSTLTTKIIYLILAPIIFIPTMAILGFMLIFSYLFALRLIWVIVVIATATASNDFLNFLTMICQTLFNF